MSSDVMPGDNEGANHPPHEIEIDSAPRNERSRVRGPIVNDLRDGSPRVRDNFGKQHLSKRYGDTVANSELPGKRFNSKPSLRSGPTHQFGSTVRQYRSRSPHYIVDRWNSQGYERAACAFDFDDHRSRCWHSNSPFNSLGPQSRSWGPRTTQDKRSPNWREHFPSHPSGCNPQDFPPRGYYQPKPRCISPCCVRDQHIGLSPSSERRYITSSQVSYKHHHHYADDLSRSSTQWSHSGPVNHGFGPRTWSAKVNPRSYPYRGFPERPSYHHRFNSDRNGKNETDRYRDSNHRNNVESFSKDAAAAKAEKGFAVVKHEALTDVKLKQLTDACGHEFGPPGTNLVVQGLPYGWLERDLKRNFEFFGIVQSFHLIDNVGLVTYDSAISALHSVKALHGLEINSRVIGISVPPGEEISLPPIFRSLLGCDAVDRSSSSPRLLPTKLQESNNEGKKVQECCLDGSNESTDSNGEPAECQTIRVASRPSEERADAKIIENTSAEVGALDENEAAISIPQEGRSGIENSLIVDDRDLSTEEKNGGGGDGKLHKDCNVNNSNMDVQLDSTSNMDTAKSTSQSLVLKASEGETVGPISSFSTAHSETHDVTDLDV